jgi:UDP-glucose 4,6-dehydratase
LYAGDVADALDTIFHQGQVGESYNIGSAFEISNLDLAKRLIRLFGLEDKMDEHIEFVQDRAFNDRRYAVDCSKLERLGWRPKTPFDVGLVKSSKFFRCFAFCPYARRSSDFRFLISTPTCHSLYVYFWYVPPLVEWYSRHANEWWGDIACALVPHPLKAMPPYENSQMI